jgi:ribosomal protein S11
MLVKALANFGGIKLPINEGDILDTHDQDEIAEDQTAGGTTLTGAKVAARNVRASGNAGAVATTLPTADQLCAAIRGAFGFDVPPTNSPYGSQVAPEKEFPSNMGIIPPRSSFRFTLINANAGTNTLTAPASAGVTISGTATVVTNVWREWIVRILASAPLVIIPVTTTNTTLVLTNVPTELISRVQTGMSVFGTGIGAAARVTAVNRDLKTITVSVASTATADNVAVTFTPTVTYTNLRAGAI